MVALNLIPEVADDVLLRRGIAPLKPLLLQLVEHLGNGRVQLAENVLLSKKIL